MATNGVNGQQQQFDLYNVNYKKDIRPKDEQNTRSLFNALWDEASNMLNEADANHDGQVDANDVPKLQKLIGMLQDAQSNITKNIKKFSFDADKFKNGFEACEKSLQKVVNDIANGTYISQKQKTAEIQAQREKERAEAQQKASLEPQDTDAASQSSEDRIPNRMYWKAEQSDIEEVYATLTNPVGRNAGLYKKPQAQIGALMGFIGLYSKRLDKGQIAFLRQSIQNLNELAKQQREEELASLPASVRANFAGNNPLPDADKVKAYWNAVKTAGFSHDLKAELTVLGYSKKDAERISSQV